MQESKEKILKQVKFDRDKYNKFILDMFHNKLEEKPLSAYEFNVYYNAHKNGKDIDFNALEKFCEMIYLNWYDVIKRVNIKSCEGHTKAAILKLQTDKYYAPEEMKKRGFYNFFNGEYDRKFKNTGLRPAFVQSFFVSKDENNKIVSSDGFLHIYPPIYMTKDRIELRLYLNLEKQNILPFATAMYIKARQNQLPLYFKMASDDQRNDTFLIYTSYNNAQKYIDIIEEIKKERPMLLKGTEKVNPMLGTINGYIGVGEDPQYQKSSFNQEREVLSEMCAQELANTMKNIFESGRMVQNSRGEVLTIDEYLEYRIRQNLIEKLQKEYNAVMRTKSVQGKPLNEKEFNNYKNGLLSYIDAIKDESRFNDKFENVVKEYKYSASKGYINFNSSIKFASDNADFVRLHSKYNNPYSNVQGSGVIKFTDTISTKELNAKMLRVFPDEKQKLEARLLAPQVQGQYLNKNHVSAHYPYLNIETIMEMSKQKV